MSDRIGVMNEGRLLQVGASTEIYERPTTRFVADFIGDINLIEAKVSGPTMATLAGGQEVEVPGGESVGDQLTIALRPERLDLYDLDEPVPDGFNRIRCRVTRRLYYGDVYFYDVEAGLGSVVVVKEENRPGVELYDVGDEVLLVWNPAASSLLSQ